MRAAPVLATQVLRAAAGLRNFEVPEPEPLGGTDGQKEREAGRSRLTSVRPWVDRAWFQWLNPKYDELLSSFCLHFQLAPLQRGARAPNGQAPPHSVKRVRRVRRFRVKLC